MAQLTIQQAFDLAVRRQLAGRLEEAEQLYRQILARQPEHSGAMHYLGVTAHLLGRNDIAVDLIRRAIALRPIWAEAHYNLGIALKDKGQLDEAIAAFRQATALKPNYPEANHNLGSALRDSGQLDEAIAAYRQAIALSPNFAEAHSSLGNALRGKGRLDEAIAACRQAIALNPNFPEAHNNLGSALKEKGQLDEAIAAYRQAFALRPNYAEAHSNLGNALRDKGQLDEAIAACRQGIVLNRNLAEAYNNLGSALKDKGQLVEAIAAYRQAIALKPDYAEAPSNLGNALKDKGRLDEAIAAFRQAIALNPNSPEAHNNLGSALNEKRQLDEAIAACGQAIALRPNYAEAHNNLGNALKDMGQLDEGIAAYRQAIAINPNLAEAHNNLANVLKDKGQLDEAITAFRQSIALKPNYAEAHSNLVFAMHYHPGYDAQAIAEEQGRWNRQHAEPLQKFIQIHSNDPSADRRLRIGYVSPDFRDHPVGRNLLPLFLHHDRRQMDITCYAQVPLPDVITSRFQQSADCWRNVVGLSDDQVAKQIREDRIDILVDLALHTANNRLLVFARKPAPVQVTFAGYPGGTGLSTIDYRLSDPYLDPPGMDESVYSERTIRLPDSFWCFDPLENRDIPVNSLPALETGFVTFGCLNTFCKVNDGVLALWAQVLLQVENSRLLLLVPHGSHRERTLERLSQEGIEPGRVEFIPRKSRQGYLQLYHGIDLSLDSFPYNGHSTSLDSYWMGVPVITLVGKTVVGRAGLSQLTNLGLTELIAHTPEQYVRIAMELAKDLPKLGELRSTLRRRMEQSPLMNAPRFARNIEAAYREIWRTWRETVSAKS
ncbi:MAG: tetratricopeptide repeat protein [Tepidisphaeraceae bacterium]|jgi:predicted O-linked N-acetylglucosamine transferase (SPINDLY family)